MLKVRFPNNVVASEWAQLGKDFPAVQAAIEAAINAGKTGGPTAVLGTSLGQQYVQYVAKMPSLAKWLNGTLLPTTNLSGRINPIGGVVKETDPGAWLPVTNFAPMALAAVHAQVVPVALGWGSSSRLLLSSNANVYTVAWAVPGPLTASGQNAFMPAGVPYRIADHRLASQRLPFFTVSTPQGRRDDFWLLPCSPYMPSTPMTVAAGGHWFAAWTVRDDQGQGWIRRRILAGDLQTVETTPPFADEANLWQLPLPCYDTSNPPACAHDLTVLSDGNTVVVLYLVKQDWTLGGDAKSTVRLPCTKFLRMDGSQLLKSPKGKSYDFDVPSTFLEDNWPPDNYWPHTIVPAVDRLKACAATLPDGTQGFLAAWRGSPIAGLPLPAYPSANPGVLGELGWRIKICDARGGRPPGVADIDVRHPNGVSDIDFALMGSHLIVAIETAADQKVLVRTYSISADQVVNLGEGTPFLWQSYATSFQHQRRPVVSSVTVNSKGGPSGNYFLMGYVGSDLASGVIDAWRNGVPACEAWKNPGSNPIVVSKQTLGATALSVAAANPGGQGGFEPPGLAISLFPGAGALSAGAVFLADPALAKPGEGGLVRWFFPVGK